MGNKIHSQYICGDVWISGDTHFRHNNILKHCKRTIFLNNREKDCLESGEFFKPSYESTCRMNDGLLDEINSCVKENDTYINLGDFTTGHGGNYHNFRTKIKCKNVILLKGNHDKCHLQALNSIFTLAFEEGQIVYAKIHDREFAFCHYPLLCWNKIRYGVMNLYGHEHSNIEEWADRIMPHRRAKDVGVDQAYKQFGRYRPFNIKEIIEELDARPGFSAGHHNPQLDEET